MKNQFLTLQETITLIEENKVLVISADDTLLQQLPKGNWVAATIPYFYFEGEKGKKDTTKLIVSDFTEIISNFKIITYKEYELYNFVSNSFENGFNFIVMPALTPIHLSFALEAPIYTDLYKNPLTGLIAGDDLDEFDENQVSKVYNGLLGESYNENAVMLHAELPSNKKARVEIVNCFVPDTSCTIRVEEDTFRVTDCTIDGEKDNLADYFIRTNYDTRFPITCDYGDKIVNVGIQNIDKEKREVVLYGPMFDVYNYHLSFKIPDYPKVFKQKMKELEETEKNMIYNCNCIQNYVNGELDQQTTGFTGAATFGEIAYQLVNQSFTYLALDDVE